MTSSIHHLLEEPIAAFAILLAVILVVPFLAERVKLPGLVGLLVAGLTLGPHGLSLLNPDGQIMHLLSDIGLLYLMFVAGLEIDMGEFQKIKYRAAGFGSLTFSEHVFRRRACPNSRGLVKWHDAACVWSP